MTTDTLSLAMGLDWPGMYAALGVSFGEIVVGALLLATGIFATVVGLRIMKRMVR